MENYHMSDIILRTSERTLFKKCQWRWERNYQDGLTPRYEDKSALWFGTGIHLALEKYYIPGEKRGVDPVETWKKYCDDTGADTTYINTEHNGDGNFAVEAKELGSAMLRAYLEEYGNEAWMKVIATEFDFQVGVRYDGFYRDDDGEVKSKPEVGVYVGQMDLIYRDLRDGKIYVMDHKTCKQLGSANTQYLPLDDQAGAYYAVAVTALRKAKLIGPKERISGIVYNYLVKAMPDDRPKNKKGQSCNKPKKEHFIKALMKHDKPEDPEEHEKMLKKLTVAELEERALAARLTVLGEVSKNQPPKRFDRVLVKKTPKQQNAQIMRMGQDLTAMSVVRNGVAVATKNPSRDCTFCPFQELCETHERGLDYTDLAEAAYATWDPYEAHREALSNG